MPPLRTWLCNARGPRLTHPGLPPRGFATVENMTLWLPGGDFASSSVLDPNVRGAGVIRPLTGKADVSGAVNGVLTLSGTTVLKDKVVDAFVRILDDAEIENCEVKGTLTPYTNNGNSGGERSLIDTNGANPNRTTPNIRHCTMSPTHPTAWIKAGIGDRYYRDYLSYIENTIDGYSAFANPNEATGLAKIRSQGAYVKQMVQFQPDGAVLSGGAPRSHTHNDFVQLQGNYGDATDIIFEGFLFQGYLNPSIGQPSTVASFGPRNHVNGVTSTPNVGYQGFTGTRRSSATFRNGVMRGGQQTVNISGSTSDLSSKFVFQDVYLQAPGTHPEAPLRAFVLSSAYDITVARVYYEGTTTVPPRSNT